MQLQQKESRLLQVEEEGTEHKDIINEVSCIGAGLGGGFQPITELTVKKYNQVMCRTQTTRMGKGGS